MTIHTGKNGKFKFGSNFLAELISFEITEEADTEDMTVAGDAWDDHEVTRKRWSGTVTVRYSKDDSGQSPRAGDTVAIEGYTNGDGSGKEYWSGNVTITSMGIAHEYSSSVNRTYQVQGKGALNKAAVA